MKGLCQKKIGFQHKPFPCSLKWVFTPSFFSHPAVSYKACSRREKPSESNSFLTAREKHRQSGEALGVSFTIYLFVVIYTARQNLYS